MIQQYFELNGATVIVTGGAGILGREFCLALAEAGANVIVADLREDAAMSVEDEINRRGASRCLAVQTDVSSRESVDKMVDCALLKFGRIDGLVNGAALDPKFEKRNSHIPGNTFEEYSLDAWNQAIAVNLTGSFLVAQAVGRAMLRQGRGAIVNIASTYGLVGPDQRIYVRGHSSAPFYKPVAYTVTKSAVLGLTKYLATYWAGKNIRVNALSPGGVQTDNDPEFIERYSYRTPLGRMARRCEYSAAVVFLLSDASSYMTGSNLVVDGGWTAW